MNKIFFLLALFLATSLNAQFNQKSIYYTGTTQLGTGLEINDGVPNFLFNLHPEAGYFIKNKLGVGANINIDLRAPFGESGSFYNALYDINIGPNVRYYIPRASDWQLYLYGNVHLGVYQDASEWLAMKHSYYGFQLGPGVNYFFTERIAMDSRFTFTGRHARNAEMGGSHNLGKFFFEVGISVFFPSITFYDRSRE